MAKAKFLKDTSGNKVYPITHVDAIYTDDGGFLGDMIANGWGTQWYTGTNMSGTSTTTNAYSYNSCPAVKLNDIYLNTSYGYVYQCTTAGSGSNAKWTYKGSIKGANGSSITGQRGSKWFTGTAMSDTSTTTGAYTWNDSEQKYVNDMYLNTSNGNIYKCTTAGTGSNAKWTYQGCIAGKDAGTYVVTTVAELEAAATALSAASGGKIILREGTYTLSSILNLEEPITLEGMGDSTIISLTGNMPPFFTMDDRVVFRNLKINYTSTGSSSMVDGGNTDFDRCTINITINGDGCSPLIYSGSITNSDVTVDYRYASDDCAILLESGRINNSNVKIYNNTNATTGSGMGGELYIIGAGEISNCDLTVAGRESNSQYANVCGYGGTVSTITGNKITVGTYGSITKSSGGGSALVGNNDITIKGSGSVYIAGAISGNRFYKYDDRIVYIGANSTFNGNCVLNRAVNDFTPYAGTVAAFGNIFKYACSSLASTTYNKTMY